MSKASETIARYTLARTTYSEATKEFWRIKNSINPIMPTDEEELKLFKATKAYSAASKVFHEEKNIFLAEARRITNLPSGNEATVQVALEHAIHAEVAHSPVYDEIRKAVLDNAKKKEQQQASNTPMEERVFSRTEDVDVFKDLK